MHRLYRHDQRRCVARVAYLADDATSAAGMYAQPTTVGRQNGAFYPASTAVIAHSTPVTVTNDSSVATSSAAAQNPS